MTSVRCSANNKVLYKHGGAVSLLIEISLICTQLSEDQCSHLMDGPSKALKG